MATKVSAKGESFLDLHFPSAGIDLSRSFTKQPARQVEPGRYARTTPRGTNVVGNEAGTDRLRGGSRPGLTRFIDAQPAGRKFVIQLLNTVTASGYTPLGDGMQTSLSGRVVTLVTVSAGNVYIANPGDTTWTSGTNNTIETPPLNFSGIIRSSPLANKLWFADGTNYVYYDPVTNTVNPWVATAGVLPVDAGNNTPTLICTYRGSIVVSGLLLQPNAIFSSRVVGTLDQSGTNVPLPTDWLTDTATNAGSDPNSAWAIGNASRGLGDPGDKVTALIPYQDDMLVIGMDSKISTLRGHPLAGGQLDLLTTAIGIAPGQAWCQDPYGNIYFVGSKLGLYKMFPGQQPQRISQAIEQTLSAADSGTNSFALIWDDSLQAVWVFITDTRFPAAAKHLLFEQRPTAWWDVTFADTGYNPLVACTFDGNLPTDRVALIGSYDGYVRVLDHTATKDDRQDILSEVLIGPILSSDMDDIMLKDLQAIMGTASGDVTYEIYVGTSAEAAVASGAVATGTWSAGRNYNSPIRRAGRAVYVKLKASVPWSMEAIRARVETQGKVRARSK